MVHDNYILTAAHCLDSNYESIEIFYGSSDYKDAASGIAVANHAECMNGFEILGGGIDNDLALINISDDVFDDLRDTLEVAPIADIRSIVRDNPNDTDFIIAGWGLTGTTTNEQGQTVYTDTTELREGRMKFNKYTASTIKVSPKIFRGRLSAICGGDSGGPLYWENSNGDKEIAGVVSTEVTANTCLKPNDAQFVNLSQHQIWLESFPDWN